MRLVMLIVARLWAGVRWRLQPMFNKKTDYATDVSWFRKAAEEGNVFAQHALGVMYAKGEGVPQDYVQAHMWFSLCAAQGGGTNNQDIIATRMTPAQIAEAQKMAREWKPK